MRHEVFPLSTYTYGRYRLPLYLGRSCSSLAGHLLHVSASKQAPAAQKDNVTTASSPFRHSSLFSVAGSREGSYLGR